MPPLAHVSEGGKQTLEEHLLAVAQAAGVLGRKLGMGTAASLIGLLHDLGKASPEFQSYVHSFLPGSASPRHYLRGKIDHSTAGAQILLRRLAMGQAPEAEIARILSLCIASHHSGLIDCVAPDGEDRLEQRLSKDEVSSHAEASWRQAPESIRAAAEKLIGSPALRMEMQAKFGAIVRDGPRSFVGDNSVQLQIGLLVRLLFSCLIDADRTNSADSQRPTAARLRQQGRYTSWGTLVARLHATIDALPATRPVDHIRHQVSDECFAAAQRPIGAYTLTVPTGGGKSLSALRFALEHAHVHGLDRVVFVSPFISIVDQNAAVARAALEPAGVPFASVVLEHHSNLIHESGQAEHWRRKLLTENWDAPVVFTTMVQVLESMFGGGTRSVRRFHALTRSVIVFDEVQTLPVRLVHLFNNAVNLLTRHCGSTVLLCTATQPLLSSVDRTRGALRLADCPELIDAHPELFERLKRYVVHDETRRDGGWSRDEIARLACDHAIAHGSCLVIVNTKRDAREIFALCRETLPEARLVHLSTSMCPAHRVEQLRRLHSWLEEQRRGQTPGGPVLCVSTQLIEAGVDIDFASVIRDLAGLDAMAQSADRCNRNGDRVGGIVTLVRLPYLPSNLVDIHKAREAAEPVLAAWRVDHPGEPFPLDAVGPMEDYFVKSFYMRQNEMSYNVHAREAGRDTTLLEMLGANGAAINYADAARKPVTRKLLRQSFGTAAACFQLMHETQGIVVPFRKEGGDIVNRLLATHDLEAEWQLLREAQRYTVSVYEQDLHRLSDCGAVYSPQDTPGLYFLRPAFYDYDMGLREDAAAIETLSV